MHHRKAVTPGVPAGDHRRSARRAYVGGSVVGGRFMQLANSEHAPSYAGLTICDSNTGPSVASLSQ